MALDDDHRRRISVEKGSPFLNHGLDLLVERLWLDEILYLFIEGRAHGRRTRERTKGLSRAHSTGVLFLVFKRPPTLSPSACPRRKSRRPRRPSCPVLGRPSGTTSRRTASVWPSPSNRGRSSTRVPSRCRASVCNSAKKGTASSSSGFASVTETRSGSSTWKPLGMLSKPGWIGWSTKAPLCESADPSPVYLRRIVSRFIGARASSPNFL